MKKALLLSGIISILLFSACTDATETPTQDNPEQTAVTDEMSATPDTSNESSMTHSEADTAAYNGALQLLDETFCDKITSATYQQECITAVKDKIALANALSEQDDSLCDQLSTNDKQEACKTQVEVEVKHQEDLQNREFQYNKDTASLDDIILNKTFDKCDTLVVEDLKYICKINAISYDAAIQKDVTLCDSIESGSDRELCISAVNESTND